MRVIFQIILAVLFLFAYTECGDTIGNRPVEVFGHFVTFREALASCKYHEMDLLMVHNKSEEQQAIDLARKNYISTIWLAATDIGEESTFVSTTTGEWLAYTNWEYGEPNNAGGREHCVQLVATEGLPHGWNDNTCDSLNAYICAQNYERKFLRFG